MSTRQKKKKLPPVTPIMVPEYVKKGQESKTAEVIEAYRNLTGKNEMKQTWLNYESVFLFTEFLKKFASITGNSVYYCDNCIVFGFYSKQLYDRLVKEFDCDELSECLPAKMTRILLQDSANNFEVLPDYEFRFKPPVWNSSLFCTQTYGKREFEIRENESVNHTGDESSNSEGPHDSEAPKTPARNPTPNLKKMDATPTGKESDFKTRPSNLVKRTFEQMLKCYSGDAVDKDLVFEIPEGMAFFPGLKIPAQMIKNQITPVIVDTIETIFQAKLIDFENQLISMKESVKTD
jgi:hypothetical protein